MDLRETLVVSHKPERRKITGAFHNDTQYGPILPIILDEKGNLTVEYCTSRIFAVELTPNHLRVPKGWEELRENLEKCTSESEKKQIRLQMLALNEVSPAKPGIVRDLWFREELRACLRQNGLDPDSPFKTEPEKKRFKKNLKELVKNKGLFLSSGVPVRRITLLKAPTVKGIPRKRWNTSTGKMEYETNPSSVRLYEPQNNHHIEIREVTKGRWKGEVITNFEAVKRIKPSKETGLQPQPIVNREDTEKGKFVMSLSIGEMVRMKHPETGKSDHFVIFKIDGNGTIHFTPHRDAGRDKETERCRAREDIRLPGKKTGGLTAPQLQKIGIDIGSCPQKVYIGPLGDEKILVRD
ncbi:MAG: hypothetical protein IMZ61_13500 [Planctomycetes bacterium]|nr:hypothetical protein [Planctomycetota bacterium]